MKRTVDPRSYLDMVHLELRFLCELDGVEGVHLATAAATAQVTVQQQPELAWTNLCMYVHYD